VHLLIKTNFSLENRGKSATKTTFRDDPTFVIEAGKTKLKRHVNFTVFQAGFYHINCGSEIKEIWNDNLQRHKEWTPPAHTTSLQQKG